MKLRVFFPKMCNLTSPPTIRHGRVTGALSEFFQGRGGFVELRYFAKYFVKKARNKGPAWKNFRVFCPRYSHNYILDTMDTIRWIQSEPFFQNQSTFFNF